MINSVDKLMATTGDGMVHLRSLQTNLSSLGFDHPSVRCRDVRPHLAVHILGFPLCAPVGATGDGSRCLGLTPE